MPRTGRRWFFRRTNRAFPFADMTVILTGPRRSGKTTLLRGAAAAWKTRGLQFGGVLSLAVGPPMNVSGYDIYDLKTGEFFPFLRREGLREWEKAGRFAVLPGAVAAASEILLRVSPENPVIIDETGPLELQGRGLWPAAARLLSAPSRPILLVVRDGLLERFCTFARLKRPHVVSIDNPSAALEIEGGLFG
jgi:nucleoside-triphosphatase THEP1